MSELDKKDLTFGGYFYNYFLLAKIFQKSNVRGTFLSKKKSLPKLIEFFNDSFNKDRSYFNRVKPGVIIRAIYWQAKYYPIASAREAISKNIFACREFETYWANGESRLSGTNKINSMDAMMYKFFDELYYFWDNDQIVNSEGNEVTRKFTMGTMRDSAIISHRNIRMSSEKKAENLAGKEQIIKALDLAAEELFTQCNFFPKRIINQQVV